METLELYALINGSTASTGGTSRGMSKDIKAVNCGLAAAFSEALPGHTFRVPLQFFNEKGKPRVIGNRAGSAFHALNELRLDPANLPSPENCAEDDAAVGAGVMAYKRYIEQCGGFKQAFANRISPEFPLDGLIAGYRRTGRLDDVINADEDEIDRWADFGIYTAVPGLYAVDYKLLKAVTIKGGIAYSRSMQALAYMALYEQQTGVRLEGFIHDLVSRAIKPDISRLLVLTPNTPEGLEIVSFFIDKADRALLTGEANSSACDSQWGSCPFISVCPRKGNRVTNAALLADQALLRGVAPEETDE